MTTPAIAAVEFATTTAAMDVVVIDNRMETIIATCVAHTITAMNTTMMIVTMTDDAMIIVPTLVATEVTIAIFTTITTEA